MRLLLCTLAVLLALPAVATAAKRDVNVQLLSLNDFHGHLEPNTPGTIKPLDTGSSSDPSVVAGGAEFLATHVRRHERRKRHSLFVSAGGLNRAKPPLSGP